MKAQKILMVLVTILLSACATTANYQVKVASWETHDARALVKTWGKPDSIEKMSNGNSMYVYARLRHAPVAYNSQRAIASVDSKHPQVSSGVYIECATYFQVTPSNKIVATEFRGDECKSRD